MGDLEGSFGDGGCGVLFEWDGGGGNRIVTTAIDVVAGVVVLGEKFSHKRMPLAGLCHRFPASEGLMRMKTGEPINRFVNTL